MKILCEKLPHHQSYKSCIPAVLSDAGNVRSCKHGVPMPPDRDLYSKIQEMTEADIPEVLRLSIKSFGAMAWKERDFLHAIESRYDYPYVIRVRGRFAGFSLLRCLGPEAEVQEICIAEAFRGKGLGSCLMDRMIEDTRLRSGSSIFLEVRVGNRAARELYRKKGFAEQYIRRAYYSDPTEDAAVLRLSLS